MVSAKKLLLCFWHVFWCNTLSLSLCRSLCCRSLISENCGQLLGHLWSEWFASTDFGPARPSLPRKIWRTTSTLFGRPILLEHDLAVNFHLCFQPQTLMATYKQCFINVPAHTWQVFSRSWRYRYTSHHLAARSHHYGRSRHKLTRSNSCTR